MDSSQNFFRARSILAIDSVAGLCGGLFVLTLSTPLAEWYALPNQVLVFNGVANLVYGCYSGALAAIAFFRGQVPRRFWINGLICANSGWSVVCATLIAINQASISAPGTAHIAFEGAFVATLALLEFRFVRPVAG